METQRHKFWRFVDYVRPYWKYLLLAVAGGIVKFTVPLLVPQVTRHLLDNVFLNEALTGSVKMRELLLYAGGMIAIFLFIYAPFVYLRHLYADKASNRAVFNMRCDLYYRILRMSASFFHRNRTGAIMTRLISDIALAQNLVGTAITNIWMDAIAVVVILYFLLRIDVLTTVVALATFPVYLFFFRQFSDKIRAVTRQLQDELSTMSSSAQERIAGSVVVHAFAQERTEKQRFEADSERLFATNMRRILMQSLNQSITGTLVGISPLIVICFGGYRVISGHMTVGELIAVTMYLSPLYLPLQRFSELNVVYANAMAALDRIYEIMDEKPEIVDSPGAVDLPHIQGGVEFDRVRFSYNENCPVLRDVSFRVRPGERVALVGPSGSGKTTIISLIPRFYDIHGGQRQRITIARAFLKDPKILILDEATANLDPESEHLIQNAMKRLVIGRTTFIIAHRLATIINADRILVLSAGKVVESGTHRELLANGGLYRDYHQKQFASAEAN